MFCFILIVYADCWNNNIIGFICVNYIHLVIPLHGTIHSLELFT